MSNLSASLLTLNFAVFIELVFYLKSELKGSCHFATNVNALVTKPKKAVVFATVWVAENLYQTKLSEKLQ